MQKEMEAASATRLKVAHVLYSPTVESVVGFVIAFNFALIVIDTDARAQGDGTISSQWVSVLDMICFCFYLVELSCRFFVERRAMLKQGWNHVDIVVVFSGAVEYVLDVIGGHTKLGILRAARLFRLLRLLRAVKLMGSLRELKKLVQMIMTCFRTLFWSFILTFLIMTMWSVAAVELIHPLLADLPFETRENFWSDCERCDRSFASVMSANLSFFQTIVAGDSWGQIAVPTIETHPWTLIIFAGSLLSLVFGVLNMIVAVVVDSFADVRQDDTKSRSAERDAEELREKLALHNIFQRIDADNSGGLTFDELQRGAFEVDEFACQLRVMDITHDDLHQLFLILDEDGNGEVEPVEFIEALYRMKTVDAKTAAIFVKHYVSDIRKKLIGVQSRADEFEDERRRWQDALTLDISRLLHHVGGAESPLAAYFSEQPGLRSSPEAARSCAETDPSRPFPEQPGQQSLAAYFSEQPGSRSSSEAPRSCAQVVDSCRGPGPPDVSVAQGDNMHGHIERIPKPPSKKCWPRFGTGGRLVWLL